MLSIAHWSSHLCTWKTSICCVDRSFYLLLRFFCSFTEHYGRCGATIWDFNRILIKLGLQNMCERGGRETLVVSFRKAKRWNTHRMDEVQQCSISSPNTIACSRQNYWDVHHNLTQKPEHHLNLGNLLSERLFWTSLLNSVFSLFNLELSQIEKCSFYSSASSQEKSFLQKSRFTL